MLLAAIVASIAVGQVFALAGKIENPLLVHGGPGYAIFLLGGLFGSFVLSLGLAPSPAERRALLLLGLVLAVGFFAADLVPRDAPEVLGAPLGALGLLAAALAVVRAPAEEREPALRRLMASALPPAFVISTAPALLLTMTWHPLAYDGLIRAFDVTLGVEPAMHLAPLVDFALLANVAIRVYLATPVGFAVLYVAQERAPRRPPIDVLGAFALASFAGFALYNVLPVVGPRYVLDVARPAAASLPLGPMVVPNVPRNCMPSLHTAWALLLFWHCRGKPLLVQIGVALFATITIFSTLAFGLHYLVDLVVAVPFALAAQAAAAPRSALRLPAITAGVMATIFWLFALRTGLLVRHPSALLSWLLVLMTAAGGLVLEALLWRASRSDEVVDPSFALPGERQRGEA